MRNHGAVSRVLLEVAVVDGRQRTELATRLAMEERAEAVEERELEMLNRLEWEMGIGGVRAQYVWHTRHCACGLATQPPSRR